MCLNKFCCCFIRRRIIAMKLGLSWNLFIGMLLLGVFVYVYFRIIVLLLNDSILWISKYIAMEGY